MNEHDSERIAADLRASGMERIDDPEQADVVVINTCCIRENADNRLYGTLGHLKSVQDRRPGMQIAVAGCLAQKDRETILDRAPYVNVVFGTHNVSRSVALLAEARERAESVVEILEAPVEPEDVPSLPRHPSMPITPTRRGSRSRWVVTTPARTASFRRFAVPNDHGLSPSSSVRSRRWRVVAPSR